MYLHLLTQKTYRELNSLKFKFLKIRNIPIIHYLIQKKSNKINLLSISFAGPLSGITNKVLFLHIGK
jgi:hypothetical protein